MKKAPAIKLSLRKLFVAMLAIGPLAILPSPVWATLPTTTSFTVTNGAAVVSPANGSGTVSTITVSDKSVLVWGFQNATATQVANTFNVGVGETYNFALPSGGAVLNKVGYNPSGALATADTATINGSLLSTGKVFILANGAISVGSGATLNTASGTVLSTLAETSDFSFTTTGNLSFTGTPAGTVAIGTTGAAAVNIAGSVSAWSAAVALNNVSVSGDMILNQSGVGTGLNLAGSGGPTSISGNLSVASNNGAITQTGSLSVGNLTTITTNGSAAGVSVSLANPLNNFGTVSANVTGTAANLTLADANDIVLGASTVGQNLVVTAAGNISTSGAVAVTNNASLTATVASASVTLASGGSVGNTINAATNGGNITLNTVGNLTVGNVTSAALTLPATTPGSGYVTAPTVTLSGANATGGTATAIVNTTTGVVTGYTPAVGLIGVPTVTLLGGGAPTTGATPGTATTNGSAITAISNGSAATGANGYVNAPAVSFTGGGGSGATATTTVNTTTGVLTFTVTNPGTGYTTAPTVVLTGGGAPTTAATTVPTAASFSGAAPVLLAASGSLTFAGGINNLSGNMTANAASINATTSGIIGAIAPSNVTTINSSAGSIVLPTVTANTLNVAAVGGSVTQIGTGATNVLSIGNATTNGTVTINAGTGNITLTANNVITGQPSGNATTFVAANDIITLTGNSASLTNTANLTLGTTNLTGNLTINTSPSTFGNGSVTIGNGFGTLSPVITVGGATSITTNGSNVGDDSAAQETFFGSITVNTIGAGFGSVATNATVTNPTASGFLITPTVVITGNTGGSNATATAGISTSTNNVTSVTVTNGGGGFAAGTPIFTFIGAGTPGTAATTGAPTNQPNGSNFSVTSVPVTTGGATYTAAPTVTFTGGTTGTGGSNATATAIVNTTSGQLISISITSGGNYSVAPTGVTLTGGGNGGLTAPVVSTSVVPAGSVNFTAATGQGKATYGQFNVTAGSLNVQETTAINLGNITAGGVTANSTTGDVLINGAITVFNGGSVSARANAGNVTEGASGVITSFGNASVTVNTSNTTGFGANLSNTGNSFPNLTVTNGATDIVVVASSVTLQQASVGSGNLSVTTVNPGNSITISAGSFGRTATMNAAGTIVLTSNNATNSVTANNLVLISGDTSATSISQNTTAASQIVSVNGTLTLTTPGGVNLNGTNNPLSGVVTLNAIGGPSVINSRGNLSVNGTSFGAVTLTSGTVGQNTTPTASNIILGNLNVLSLTANAQNGGFSGNAADLASNGASGNITQAAGSALHIENALTANTFGGGNIVIANNANSAGRIALSTGGALGVGGAGNITYVEDSTAKLGNIATNGTASLTSRFGSIIDDATASDVIGSAGGSTLVLSAPTGSVLISGIGTHTAGTTTGNVIAANISSSGAASIQSSDTITLGSVAVNSLLVSSGNNIAQSAPLSVFGTSNFTATNNITLTTAGNNFGPILASTATAGKDIVIVEANTLNLRTVTMPASTAGNFSATSTNGDIISTGFGGVRPGGTVGSPGSGTVTLAATTGNITVGDATTDFPTNGGVILNAKNVSLTVLGNSPLALGAASTPSSVSGNLTVVSAVGSIVNTGNIVVTGGASFQTGTGNITINQAGNQFGTLKFIGNQISVTQTGDMKLLTGSSALGSAQFASTGNISVVNAGGSISFGSTASLVATGNITLPKLIQAAGNLTVNAAGTKDLSALSITGDLSNKTPVNLGTGAYLAPQP